MNTTTQVCMYVLGAKAESLTASFKSALNSKIGTRPYYVYIQHLIVPMLTMSDEVAKSETKSFISEGVGWGGGGVITLSLSLLADTAAAQLYIDQCHFIALLDLVTGTLVSQNNIVKFFFAAKC